MVAFKTPDINYRSLLFLTAIFCVFAFTAFSCSKENDKEDGAIHSVKKQISVNLEKRVFLGGTVNGSTWRDQLIPKLEIDYFNPVCDDWTPEKQEEEIYQRNVCKFVLYVLTPKLTGFYSIAEVVDDSNKRPERTIFCILDEDDGLTWTSFQKKSLNAIAKMVEENGAKYCTSLDDIAKYINHAK
ncbi:MAG: nucleoside 2-deoxyribosyltransferase domain-containing protein [Hyphomicrobiales bacterium]